jgi:hypothetical protein
MPLSLLQLQILPGIPESLEWGTHAHTLQPNTKESHNSLSCWSLSSWPEGHHPEDRIGVKLQSRRGGRTWQHMKSRLLDWVPTLCYNWVSFPGCLGPGALPVLGKRFLLHQTSEFATPDPMTWRFFPGLEKTFCPYPPHPYPLIKSFSAVLPSGHGSRAK